jgi:hypothetical protein
LLLGDHIGSRGFATQRTSLHGFAAGEKIGSYVKFWWLSITMIVMTLAFGVAGVLQS